jgi:hypothetical protein
VKILQKRKQTLQRIKDFPVNINTVKDGTSRMGTNITGKKSSGYVFSVATYNVY